MTPTKTTKSALTELEWTTRSKIRGEFIVVTCDMVDHKAKKHVISEIRFPIEAKEDIIHSINAAHGDDPKV